MGARFYLGIVGLLLSVGAWVVPGGTSAVPEMGALNYFQEDSPITFRDSDVINDFPESLTFNIVAETSAAEVTSASLVFSARDDTSVARVVVDFNPASTVELTYVWETGNVTIAPSTPIVYHWEVADSAGNQAQSPMELVYYDDVRYEWNILEDDNIAVWWHDRPISFGGSIFEIAQEAFQNQLQMFGADLEYQIRLIIYNDFDEFAEWHSYASEFIGGQAFPSIGVTTQIVSAYDSTDLWLQDVIPHEISHLYLYQATYHPLSRVPAWLDEGIAQLNEFSEPAGAIDYAESAIRRGDLLPLWSLSGSFGYREEQVRLAYAEALSAATFVRERYGDDRISKLLAAYKRGLSGDEALMEGLGVTLYELQSEWLEWMGVDPGLYPTPTSAPTVAWPTPPSYSTPTIRYTNTPVQEIAASATLSSGSLSSPTAIALAIETRVEPTEMSSEITSQQDDVLEEPPEDRPKEEADEGMTGRGGLGICGAVALPALAAILFVIPSRLHKR